MANKLIYIPNNVKQNRPFCRLKLVCEKFEHSTKLTNQSKYNVVANKYENVNTKVWGPV